MIGAVRQPRGVLTRAPILKRHADPNPCPRCAAAGNDADAATGGWARSSDRALDKGRVSALVHLMAARSRVPRGSSNLAIRVMFAVLRWSRYADTLETRRGGNGARGDAEGQPGRDRAGRSRTHRKGIRAA